MAPIIEALKRRQYWRSPHYVFGDAGHRTIGRCFGRRIAPACRPKRQATLAQVDAPRVCRGLLIRGSLAMQGERIGRRYRDESSERLHAKEQAAPCLRRTSSRPCTKEFAARRYRLRRAVLLGVLCFAQARESCRALAWQRVPLRRVASGLAACVVDCDIDDAPGTARCLGLSGGHLAMPAALKSPYSLLPVSRAGSWPSAVACSDGNSHRPHEVLNG